MLLWLLVSGVLIAALLAAWLCLRPRRSKDAPDLSLIASWRARADEMRRRLEQAPENEWAWLWRIRLRVMTFLLGRAADQGHLANAASVASVPPDPPAAPPMTPAQSDEAFATYTRDRERARMDWTPPWSRGGDSLAKVLTRVSENSAEGPANVDESIERLEKRLELAERFNDRLWDLVWFFGRAYVLVIIFLLFCAGQVGYYWSLALILRDGLQPARLAEIPAALIAAYAASMNLCIVLVIVENRRRSVLWLPLAFLGIVGVFAAFHLPPRVSAKPQPTQADMSAPR